MKQAAELMVGITPENWFEPEFASEGEAYQKHDDKIKAIFEADKTRREIEDELPF